MDWIVKVIAGWPKPVRLAYAGECGFRSRGRRLPDVMVEVFLDVAWGVFNGAYKEESGGGGVKASRVVRGVRCEAEAVAGVVPGERSKSAGCVADCFEGIAW